MNKQLEKTLKDAVKDDAFIIGAKQVLGSISKSKLVLLSKSVPSHISEKIEDDAKKSKVSTITYNDTSVNLGKLCGLQFRVSAISLTNITDADIKTLQKETESQ
ncbi:MAG: ribosomal L7Ae/L30e/S12e/Gadd45 family protein [Candidatus Nitrosopelagicus sp.]|nr:ribosomal L7Ae/L30e/S12e/Gadd45 family protein [Candidatus Nitrosopelagicus sp.]